MLPAIFEFSTTTLSVFFCAIAIKLADDYLDRDLDTLTGRKNWAHFLENGTMFYAMLMLIIAAGLNPLISMPLFLSSYIIGMFNDFTQVFPSKLSGWQESLLILIIGIIIFKWEYMLFSLLFIIAVQLIDDCIDYKIDTMAGHRNFAHKIGIIESLLIAGLAILSAAWLNERIFAPVLCGTILFYLGLFYKEATR